MSRFRDLLRKYGKVALGVHFSVSAASITALYIAINNNVDVQSLLDKVGMDPSDAHSTAQIDSDSASANKGRNRTAEIAASSGGALALAFLCNKALLPVRLPITFALTPAVARLLTRRNIVRSRF